MMRKTIEIDIEDLAYNGQALGHVDGKVTFIKGGLPGERVEAEIIKSKKKYNLARVKKILIKSPERIDPVCRHFEQCGGCTWQDLGYDRQLYYKKKQVDSCLEHIGGLKDTVVEEIRPAPDIFYYRNKMEFTYHRDTSGESPNGFTLGMHERGRFDKVFDIDDCRLQSQMSNKLLDFIRQKTIELKIPAYDIISHTGFMRYVVIREGKNTGQVMLVLFTGEGAFTERNELTASLVEKFPDLTTIVWVVNPTITNIARGEIREILHGPGYIEEEILGLKFRISPTSFFQTNSLQSENLYREVIAQADPKPDENLLDLYCGAGAIGICTASQAGTVIGIDIEEESIAAARANAQINGIDNCRFYAGPARKVLLSDELKNISYGVAIIDPPRAGMHPKALKRLIEIDANRLVYVSCNPATFARDAALLSDAGYSLRRVIPIDMFPHTMHIELVSRFEKNA